MLGSLLPTNLCSHQFLCDAVLKPGSLGRFHQRAQEYSETITGRDYRFAASAITSSALR